MTDFVAASQEVTVVTLGVTLFAFILAFWLPKRARQTTMAEVNQEQLASI